MRVTASRSRWIAATRLAMPVMVVVFGVISVSLAQQVTVPPTTYAATSTFAVLADLAAGIGLLTAGVLTFVARPFGSIGPVTALIGVAWLAADWIGWHGGPSFPIRVAMLAVLFALPLAAHLAFAFPSGRVKGRPARAILAAAYGAATMVAIGLVLAGDPFLDRYCWRTCTHTAFVVRADVRVMRALTISWLCISVGVGLLLCIVCIRRLAVATPVARTATRHVLVPVALVATAEGAYAALRLRIPAEEPTSVVFAVVFFARAAAMSALAGGVTWSVIRSHRTTRAVARLSDELGDIPPPGALKAVLARSLGDDGLDVAYWLPGGRRYTDEAGHPVTAQPGPGQTTTAIVRQGRPVALVIHDRGLADERNLEREIGAAARLAVDNERLHAEVRAKLADLRASRSRIVATGDKMRRSLERNLHDGAQQRLLATSFELSRASAAAVTEGDAALGRLLESASADTQEALTELRELARGIFPAILTEAGLGPALWTLADNAPIAVEVLDVVTERHPLDAETAAYLVVSEAINDAVRRSASYVTARVLHRADHLVVETRDDGANARSDDFTHAEDRVVALGGRLDVGTNTVRAEIPCV